MAATGIEQAIARACGVSATAWRLINALVQCVERLSVEQQRDAELPLTTDDWALLGSQVRAQDACALRLTLLAEKLALLRGSFGLPTSPRAMHLDESVVDLASARLLRAIGGEDDLERRIAEVNALCDSVETFNLQCHQAVEIFRSWTSALARNEGCQPIGGATPHAF